MTGALPRIAAPLALCALLLGCENEQRDLRGGPPARATAPADDYRMSKLVPGHPAPPGGAINPFEDNVYALQEGRRMYQWFGCVGCHAAGGGGMGPALMDDDWVYGGEPEDVFRSIREGRPEGMPAFGGRIPDEDIWKLTAYVRSLSGKGRQLPEGTRSLPLQEEASAHLPDDFEKYYEDAGDE